MARTDKSSGTVVYEAAAVRDALGVCARPGAVAVREGRIAAAGAPGRVREQVAAFMGECGSKGSGSRTHAPQSVGFEEGKGPWVGGVRVVELPDRVILPAMVNAHAHLDLTAIGPQPYGGDFVDWVVMLSERRPRDPEGVYRVVASAAKASMAAGVGCVGNVGGRTLGGDAGMRAMQDGGLRGVAFMEMVGITGERVEANQAWMNGLGAGDLGDGRTAMGIQPHAPYSTGPRLYQAAIDAAKRHGLGLSTHLAEMLEEAEFVGQAKGRFRVFLEQLGGWRDEIAALYGDGLSPVQWMKPFLEQAPWVLAHCNYAGDQDIAILAQTGASVAYCPVASAYFGHPHGGHGPHRYRDMLAAGVNVCLGTDSVICQPVDETQPLGILPQMRFLHRRDGTDPDVLLRMATVNGAKALGMDERLASLQPGRGMLLAESGLVNVKIDPADATDPLVQVLKNDEPVQVIAAEEGESARGR